MKAKISPPFRAEQVGSLLRPRELLKARDEFEGDQYRTVKGNIAATQLKDLEDRCIRDAVAYQEKLGLKSITDGDFRRRSWWQDFALALEGVQISFTDYALAFHDSTGNKIPSVAVVVDTPIRRNASITVESFKFLKTLTHATPKITIPSPPIIHFFGGRRGISESIYPTLDAFWADLTSAYRAEIRDLWSAGCTYLQLDECIFALMCDPKVRAALEARGDNPDHLLGEYTAAINAVIDGCPAGMTIGMHLCRGNNRGHWLGEGGYDYVAETLFKAVKVDAFFLEYDSPRAGGFTPLRHVPDDKIAVLGLITTKTPQLEDATEIEARINEASRYVALDRICLSPQCGFASNYAGNPVTFEDQTKKLQLVLRVAEEVWGHA
jgi:5-methyltetrahydropteroyltriglutamate--homocysteine methyltransferase